MLPTFDSVRLVCECLQISVKFSMNGACKRNWPLQHDAANLLSTPVSPCYLVPSFRAALCLCACVCHSPPIIRVLHPSRFFFIHQPGTISSPCLLMVPALNARHHFTCLIPLFSTFWDDLSFWISCYVTPLTMVCSRDRSGHGLSRVARRRHPRNGRRISLDACT